MIRCCALALGIAFIVRADPLEDAARTLAQKVAAHTAANDTFKISERNISSLPASEVSRARRVVERSLRRPVRGAATVEVVVTLSETPHDLVLVAEIARGDERWAEVTTYRQAIDKAVRSMAVIETRLVWEQEQPLLDVREQEGMVNVLDVNELAVYEKTRRLRAWANRELVRDPMGRLSIDGDRIFVQTPQRECRGAWRPEISITCTTIAEHGNLWRIPAIPPHYSMATLKGGAYVLAEPDGLAHLYSADGKPLAAWSTWGGEMATVCGDKILASSDRSRDRGDVLRLFRIEDAKPVPSSEPLELRGPVIAMSARNEGALAIIHDLTNKKYAAYHVTVDCSR